MNTYHQALEKDSPYCEERDEDGSEKENFGDMEEEQTEPFDPKKVDIQVTQSIMDAIIKRLRNNEIDLSPEFQRSTDLWEKKTQSRLIESLLINLPIPAFYFDATNEDSWQIVDGLQRLSTIKHFVIDKKLKLTGLEFLKKYDNSTFDDLPRTLQRRIEEFPVTLYLIKPGTPVKMKYSLFHRINTGGLILKPQEIRHAISHGINKGQAARFLKELSEEPSFRKVVKISSDRMSNRELVLRHIAFAMEGVDSYKSSMVKFLDAAMEKLGKCRDSELQEYKKGFLQAMDLAWTLFREHAFKKSSVESGRIKVVNKPLFEALSVPLAQLDPLEKEILLKNKEIFLKEFKELMQNDSFYRSISISTANKDQVDARFKKINELVRKFCEE